MKVLAVFVACLAIALGETPVPLTQYLLTPSSQYGTPATQHGVPNDYTITFIPPEQYGTPNLQYNFQVGVPKPQYGVPAVSNNAIPESYFGAGSKSTSGQYLAPQTTNQFIPSTNQNPKYTVSTSNSVHSTSTNSKPRNQYDIHNTYLASTEANHLDKYDEANDEPANYGFKYYVQDNEGNDFGHEEVREGDVTNGRYQVLLPDGKRQTVEYTADAGGYKPRISYEQVGSGYAPDNGGYEQGNIKNAGYSR